MLNDDLADRPRHLTQAKRVTALWVGSALVIAGILLARSTGSAPEVDDGGIVYVYFPSICERPGDPDDCHEIPRSSRPSFESMEACSAHADAELRQEHDPRLMASCLRQREG
jgi:hypothetical protein